MSKLKARRAYFSEDDYERGTHKICAKVSDCGYDRKNDWWSYAFEDEVYLKSEADKVIAELKESVKGLILDNYLKDKETRHNKYKRCLAMASYWVAVSYQCVDDKHRQSAERHHRKWLELAEKFKEA